MATMRKVLTCTNAAFIMSVNVLNKAAFIRCMCFDGGERNTVSQGNNVGEVATGTRWHLVYRVTMRELLSCHKHYDKTAALLFVFISFFKKYVNII